MWIKHKVRSLEFLKFDIDENIHFVQQKIFFAFSNVKVPEALFLVVCDPSMNEL